MSLLRRALIVLLVMLALAAGVAAWAWIRARQAPAWYEPPDPVAPEIVRLAEDTEYDLVEEFHRIRPDEEPWNVRLEEKHLNAWFAARLPEWVAHDGKGKWPAELGPPQIHIGPNGVEMAIEARGQSQLIVTRVDPQISSGRLQLVVDRVGLGRLAVPGAPAASVLEMLDRFAPGGLVGGDLTSDLLGMVNAKGGGGPDASIRLPDGRRVQLVDIALVKGAIDLTNRTLPAGD